MELYLLHGEREFSIEKMSDILWLAREDGYLRYKGFGVLPIYKLTPKALEYIKNLDNP